MAGGIDSIFANPARKDHWIKRGIAYIIDSVIIFVVYIILVMVGTMIFIGSVIGGAMTGNPVGGVFGGLLILFLFILIAFIFSIVYWIYFDAKGGTPGKRFMKLTPVALHGEMGYGKAAIRNGSKIVGGFIGAMVEGAVGIILIGLLIEIIIVLIDVYLGITSGKDPRQKYTDTIADTIVIRTDIEEDVEAMRYVPPQTTTPTPSSGASTSEPTKVTSNNLTPESSAPEPTSETTKTTTIQQEPEGTIDKAVDVGSVAEDIAKVSAAENETMNRFMELFEITEERAQALYKAGYKKLDDFKDAIVEDLVMVDQINPTIARRIIDKISNEKL